MAMYMRQMNLLRPTVSYLCSKVLSNQLSPRTFSVLSNRTETTQLSKTNIYERVNIQPLLNSHSALIPFDLFQFNQIRFYKAKNILHLRCKGCYFVKRHDRLFVECKLKPRHKQMKKMSKHDLYKEDYSKGNVNVGCFWNFRHDRNYQMGNNQYAKHNWLEGKLGHTI